MLVTNDNIVLIIAEPNPLKHLHVVYHLHLGVQPWNNLENYNYVNYVIIFARNIPELCTVFNAEKCNFRIVRNN